MQNLREAFLLAVITTYQTCFIWDGRLDQAVGVLVFTIMWWCLLAWREGVKEKFERRRTNEVPHRIRGRKTA